MTQTDPDPTSIDCLLTTIVEFLLPFFLTGAAFNADIANAAIREMVQGYNPASLAELDLVGRVIGFSIASSDNLRLSMVKGLPDTKVLRYRCNAATLSRSSDQAHKMLIALQAGQELKRAAPRPTVADAPNAAVRLLAPPAPAVQGPTIPAPMASTPTVAAPTVASVTAPTAQALPSPATNAVVAYPPVIAAKFHIDGLSVARPVDIEATKRDARMLMSVFSKNNMSVAALPSMADPAAFLDAALRASAIGVKRPLSV